MEQILSMNFLIVIDEMRRSEHQGIERDRHFQQNAHNVITVSQLVQSS